MVVDARTPMSPEEYLALRRDLWAKRGPNVKTDNDEKLMPCYVHALEKTDPNFRKPAAAVRVMPPESAASRDAVIDAMAKGVATGVQEPFYTIDLGAALERLALWRSELPNIEPHYAVKCNGDPALLLTLANAGLGFDCASKAEIEAITRLGVPASRVLYANPIKQPSHVSYAAERGVPLTVFDAADELDKMAALYPGCGLLLRLAVDDSAAQCVLSNKYGAQPKDAAALLEHAARLQLRVVGVSFHVGSGSSSSDAFRDAVARAAAVFDLASARGQPMQILDVGGGVCRPAQPHQPHATNPACRADCDLPRARAQASPASTLPR